MPKKRVPPDKRYFTIEDGQDIEATEEVQVTETKKKLKVSWNQELVQQSVVLPSNLDSKIAAMNELLGKSKHIIESKNEQSKEVLEKEKKRKRKEPESRATKKGFIPKSKVIPMTDSNSTTEVNDDIIVKLHQVELPPRPTLTPIPKPTERIKSNFLRALSELLVSSKKMVKPKVRFDICMAAAEENFKLLETNNFNLDRILNTEGETSVTSYGSEFKSVQELDSLFGNHPRWPALRLRLATGSSWKMMQTDEQTRNKDLTEAIIRGNHKSADKNATYLSNALEKEINKGWELMLPLKEAHKIPGLIMSPMGVAEQIGVNEHGEFVPKKRLTHWKLT